MFDLRLSEKLNLNDFAKSNRLVKVRDQPRKKFGPLSLYGVFHGKSDGFRTPCFRFTWNSKDWETNINNEETQNLRLFHALFKKLWDKRTKKNIFVLFQLFKNWNWEKFWKNYTNVSLDGRCSSIFWENFYSKYNN